MPGVNKFDTPAQAQFMNTYVPIPFAEMQEAVATRQDRLDRNLAQMDSANLAAQNLNYISNSVDEDYIKGTVQPGMENIVTEFSGQDLSDPAVYNALRARMSSTLDKGRIKDIQSSYAAHQQNLQTVGKLKAQGKYQEALDLADPTRGGNFDSRTGVFNYQTEAALDIRKAAEQYFNNLKADTGWNPETGMIHSGISDAKIRSSAQENIRSFIDSKEGEQAVRIAAYRNNVDYDKLSNEQKENYAMDVLIEVGDEFGYSSTTPMSGYASYKKGQQDTSGNPWRTTTHNTSPVKVGAHENIKSPSDAAGPRYNVISDPSRGGHAAVISDEAVTSEQISERSKRLDDLRSEYPVFKDLTDEELVDTWNTTMNSVNFKSLGLTDIPSPKAAEMARSRILSSLTTENIWLYDSHGVSKSPKLTGEGKKEGLLKELGKSFSELQEYIENSPAPKITQDGPEAGMYWMSIPDKKGRARNVLFGSDNNTRGIMDASYQLSQNRTNLDDSPVPSGMYDATTGDQIWVRSIPTPNVANKAMEYSDETGTMVNGKFIKTGDVSRDVLDIIKNSEIDDYMNSGFIGTDINYNPGGQNKPLEQSFR